MISALADAGGALDRPDYVDAAVACAGFVWGSMRDGDGRLLRTYNRGEARLAAYLEDHAFLLEALLTLYGATFDPRWFDAARELADTIIARFSDAGNGGFFATADDHETLIARRKDLEDNPIPSGASAAAFGLLRLAALTGEHRYEEAALGVIRLLHGVAPEHPHAFGHLLQAMDFHFAAVTEVAIAGADAAPLERVVRGAYRPHVVLAGGRRATCRSCRAASRSRVARRPTSASVSPACGRSRSRRSSKRCSDQSVGSMFGGVPDVRGCTAVKDARHAAPPPSSASTTITGRSRATSTTGCRAAWCCSRCRPICCAGTRRCPPPRGPT